MPRHHRLDYPGAAHHVFNRGLARRTVFEYEEDVRFALSLFAREVRAGTLRLHSYSFLTTHFHALIESPEGHLSQVMQRITNLYVRRFNRLRKRDGPLFRGRFGSRLVESNTYRETLIRYIDQNAPEARLASSAPLYPYGSACHLAARRRPLWLDTAWVDRVLGSIEPSERLTAYCTRFGDPLTEEETALVQERLRASPTEGDPLDDLVRASPPEVLAWMIKKATLADGTSPGLPCAGRNVLLGRVQELRDTRGPWFLQAGGRRGHEAWPILSAGLLRHVAALPFAEIGVLLVVTTGQAMRLNELHGKWILMDPEYAEVATAIVMECTQGLVASPADAIDPAEIRRPELR
jgi:REP element-mobilizing transposase RayT